MHAPVLEPKIVEGGAISELEFEVNRAAPTPQVERTVVLETEPECDYVAKEDLLRLIDPQGIGKDDRDVKRGTPPVPGGAHIGQIGERKDDECDFHCCLSWEKEEPDEPNNTAVPIVKTYFEPPDTPNAGLPKSVEFQVPVLNYQKSVY